MLKKGDLVNVLLKNTIWKGIFWEITDNYNLRIVALNDFSVHVIPGSSILTRVVTCP